jgi:general secretion pathway protein F
MAHFSYLAVDIDGREKRGAIDAVSEQAARSALATKKLVPVRISVTDGRSATRETPRPGPAPRGTLRHKDRVLVTRQLATLIGAAVPVDEALGIISRQQESSIVRRVMEDVRLGIQEGLRLADALGRHPASFPNAYRAAVAGGERAGNLSPVLNRLAEHLAREHALRSKIATAMVYPAALLTVATVVVSCLMIFVVPTLVVQFEAFKGQLPLITTILIAVSNFVSRDWPLLLIALLVAGLLVRTALRQEGIRGAVDGMFLKAPGLGKWMRALNSSRFIRSVSTLTSSGLPVLDSVRAARDSVQNREFAKAISRVGDRIEEGESLSHAMQHSGLFPLMVVYMTIGGENAGELPAMLEKASDHLDQEIESFAQAALSLVEPAIIVLMGAVVAGIVLAIMLPILQLNQLAIG